MKILWHSNHPEMGTGYGVQTALFAERLAKAGHEVAISAFAGLVGHPGTWRGLPVYPAGGEPYGMDMVEGHYRHFGADLLLILVDVWCVNPEPLIGSGMNTAWWMPVDCHRVGKADTESLRQTSAQPIAFSRHGEQALTAAGFAPLYVPHGIDTSVFRPPENKTELRHILGLPTDRFIVGMNAANRDKARKSFSESFQAFAAFHKRHPEALLMVHTEWQNLFNGGQPGQGLDLGALAELCGLRPGVDVIFADQYALRAGMITTEEMVRFYQVCDVFLNASHGEGFGIPIVEAQACGVPVIVTDGSSMAELAGPGWKVPGQNFYAWLHDAWWVTPDVPAIARALEKALRYADSKREAAREFALAYDADRVAREYWGPALAALSTRLTLPR